MPTIAGRDISIKKLNETQVMLIMREGSILKSPKADLDRRMKGVATILDIIESSVEDADDLEFLMRQVSIGKVEFPELLSLVAPESEEAPKAPVRRAARKR